MNAQEDEKLEIKPKILELKILPNDGTLLHKLINVDEYGNFNITDEDLKELKLTEGMDLPGSILFDLFFEKQIPKTDSINVKF